MPYIILCNPSSVKSKIEEIGNYSYGEDWFILETEDAKDKFVDEEFEFDAGESIYIFEIGDPVKFEAQVTTELKEVKK